MPCYAASCLTQSMRVRASPSWEVPNPEVVTVTYFPSALSCTIAIVMRAGVVAALVATMATRIAASGGRSWNHIPGFVRGCRYMGAASGAQWG